MVLNMCIYMYMYMYAEKAMLIIIIHDVCIYIYTRACMYYVHVAVKLL